MKNIETPLTWGLGVLVIVLLVLNSLNNTVVEYNISDTSSDLNSEFNLDHNHQAQAASSFNILNIFLVISFTTLPFFLYIFFFFFVICTLLFIC